MSKEVKELLQSDDKGIKRAEGPLSRLFRQVLFDIDLNLKAWSSHMNKYLDNPRNGVGNTPRERSTARGNLNKVLNKPNMTWRNFIDALRFLNPVKVTFEITLTWHNGKQTVHRVSQRIGTLTQIPEELDDE